MNLPAFWSRIIGLTCTFLALVNLAAAQTPPPDLMNTVATDLSSPGWAWATPLRGGPIRALIIAPRYTLRDAATLARRLELDMRIVPLWGREQLGLDDRLPMPFDGASQSAVAEDLMKALDKKLDVIIAANFAWQALPAELSAALLKRVSEGTGLVLVTYGGAVPPGPVALEHGTEASNRIATGTGIPHVPGWEYADNLVATGTWDNGRVAHIDYPGPPPLTHAFLPTLGGEALSHAAYHEPFYSLVARACRWAAGHDAPVDITGYEYRGPEEPEAEDIPPLNPEFVQFMKEQAVQQPSQRYALTLAEPLEGRYRLATALRHPGSDQAPVQIFNPGSSVKGSAEFPFFVLAAPGRYFVDFVIREQSMVRAGDDVVAWHTDTITVEGFPAFTDVRLNKAAVTPFDAIGIEASIQPRVFRPRPTAVYARAVDPFNRVVAETKAVIPPGETTVTFPLDLTDLLAPRIKVQILATEAEGPVDLERELLFNPGQTFYLPVMRSARNSPFGLGFQWDKIMEPNVRRMLHDLSDAGADTFFAYADPDAAFFGSEAALETVLRLPAVESWNDAFRSEAYRNGVRQFWDVGTDVPKTTDDTAVAAGVGEAAVAARVDGLPEALARLDAARSWILPYRLARQVPGFTAGLRDSWLAIPPGRILSSEEAQWLPWFAAIRGFGGITLDTPYGDSSATTPGAALAPDGRLLPAFSTLAGSVKRLRDTAGPLLRRASWVDSGIAVLSAGASDEPEGTGAWWQALHAAGFQGRTIGLAELVRRGPEACTVLLLPDVAMDAATAREVARFAAMGGVIVSESLPRVSDGDGSRIVAPLAPVFGVAEPADAEPTIQTVEIDGEGEEARTYRWPAGGIFAELELTDGEASGTAGGAPVWIKRDIGAAPALLLNHAIPATPDALVTFAEPLRAFLLEAGGKPLPDLDVKPSPYPGQYAMFRYGKADLFVLLRSPDDEFKRERATLRLPEGGYAYDVLNSLPVMNPNRTSVALDSAEAAVISHLPYGVSEIELVAPEAVEVGRRVEYALAIKTVDALPDTHMLQVTFRPLGGEPVPWYTHTLECTGGHAQGYIPLARNEEIGWYGLTVRDLLTGVSVSAQVEVRGTIPQ